MRSQQYNSRKSIATTHNWWHAKTTVSTWISVLQPGCHSTKSGCEPAPLVPQMDGKMAKNVKAAVHHYKYRLITMFRI